MYSLRRSSLSKYTGSSKTERQNQSNGIIFFLKVGSTSAEGVEKDVDVILEAELVNTSAWSGGRRLNVDTPQSDQRVGRDVDL